MRSDRSDGMANDTPTDDHGDAGSETFERWLDQAAESKGVSKQEMMNQMLSSYWILDELTGLVNEAETMEDNSESEASQPNESPTESGDVDIVAEPERAAGPDSGDSTEEAIQEIHAAIRELLESQPAVGDRQSENDSEAIRPSLDGGVVSVVSDLQRQVGKFESKVEDLETDQKTQFERLSGEIQLVLDRVNQLERKQDRFVEEREIEDLVGDIREVNEELESLQTADRELEEQMNREFDSIETLFSRILDAIDEINSDLDAATESFRKELEPIQQRQTDQKRLEEIKSDALRRDVRHGACDSCGQGIDLALLESPACPNCSAEFEGIGKDSWNPFRSPTIETKSPTVDRT